MTNILTARTDIHRPGAMTPADYEVLAVACLFGDENENGTPVTVCVLEEVSETWATLGNPAASTWVGHREKQCDHCGSRLKYECVVLHKATGDIITIGRDCVKRFFSLEWSLLEQNAEARARRERNTAKFLAAFPKAADALVWATTGDGAKKKFVADLVEKVIVKGYDATPAQADALVSALAKSLAPVTFITGKRQTITGTITNIKIVEDSYTSNRYSTHYKATITVQTDEGFKVWGNLPSAHYVRPGDEGDFKGRRVSFDAALEAKDSEFATYSRPTKFVLSEKAEAPAPVVEVTQEAAPVAVQSVEAVVASIAPALTDSRAEWRDFVKDTEATHGKDSAEYKEVCRLYVLKTEHDEALEDINVALSTCPGNDAPFSDWQAWRKAAREQHGPDSPVFAAVAGKCDEYRAFREQREAEADKVAATSTTPTAPSGPVECDLLEAVLATMPPATACANDWQVWRDKNLTAYPTFPCVVYFVNRFRDEQRKANGLNP